MISDRLAARDVTPDDIQDLVATRQSELNELEFDLLLSKASSPPGEQSHHLSGCSITRGHAHIDRLWYALRRSRRAPIDGLRRRLLRQRDVRKLFFATLECELLDRRRFKTQREAVLEVFDFIEGWYNPHRRHSPRSAFSQCVSTSDGSGGVISNQQLSTRSGQLQSCLSQLRIV
jgi:hypothetical protein